MTETANSFTSEDHVDFMCIAETIKELRSLQKTLLLYHPDGQRDAVRLLHDMAEHMGEDTPGLSLAIGIGEKVWMPRSAHPSVQTFDAFDFRFDVP